MPVGDTTVADKPVEKPTLELTQPVADEPADTPEPEEGTATQGESTLFDRLRKVAGLDLSTKYQDEESLLRGLAEATKKIGERNEKAELFDHFSELIGDRGQEFSDWLNGTQRQPAKPSTNGDDLPSTLDEFMVLRAQMLDENGRRRRDIDPAIARKVEAMERKIQSTAFQWAKDPASVIRPYLDEIKQDLLKTTTLTTQQQFEQQRTQAELAEITKQHAAAMFVDGDTSRMTQFGQKVADNWTRLTKSLGAMPNAETYRTAIQMAQLELPQPQPTRKAGQKAVRQPAVAATSKLTGEELEEQFRKGLANEPGGLRLEDVLLAKLQKQ